MQWHVVVIWSIIFSSFATAQEGVSISDFKYPVTRSIDWKGTLNGSINSSGTHRPKDFVLRSNEWFVENSSEGSVQLSSSFLSFYSNDQYDQILRLGGIGFYSGSGLHRDRVDTSGVRYETNSQNWNGSVDAEWQYLHYLSFDGFHLAARVDGRYFGQSTTYEHVSVSQPIMRESLQRRFVIGFRGATGIGFGRMRDGSVVFRALRLLERLRDDGIIHAPLNREQTLRLVDRLAHQREYLTNFSRHQKYFIRDIIDALISEGILASTAVPPYAVLRLLEGLNEIIEPRQFGWRVYYLFNDHHNMSKARSRQTNHTGQVLESSDEFKNNWVYVHEVGAEYGKPLSLFTHISSSMRAYLPNRRVDTRYLITGDVSVVHELGERVTAIAGYRFELGNPSVFGYYFETQDRSITHTFPQKFVYFVEDRAQFSIDMEYQWSRTRFFNPLSVRDAKSSRFTVSFGLSYNII